MSLPVATLERTLDATPLPAPVSALCPTAPQLVPPAPAIIGSTTALDSVKAAISAAVNPAPAAPAPAAPAPTPPAPAIAVSANAAD